MCAHSTPGLRAWSEHERCPVSRLPRGWTERCPQSSFQEGRAAQLQGGALSKEAPAVPSAWPQLQRATSPRALLFPRWPIEVGKCRGTRAWLFGPKQASSDRPFIFRALYGVWLAGAVVRPTLWLHFSLCQLLLPALPPTGVDRHLPVNIRLMTVQSPLPGKHRASQPAGTSPKA